jgi:hypothetical protein
MTAKAQYQGRGLRVYITRKDFELFLENKWIEVPLYFIKEQESSGIVFLSVSEEVASELVAMLTADKEAFDRETEKARASLPVVKIIPRKRGERGKGKSTSRGDHPVPAVDAEPGEPGLSDVDVKRVRTDDADRRDEPGGQG